MHDDIKLRVKETLIKRLNLDAQPDEIGDDDPLFGADSPLGLDSVDSLEFVVGIRKLFPQVPFKDASSLKEFNSVNKVAQYIASHLSRV